MKERTSKAQKKSGRPPLSASGRALRFSISLPPCAAAKLQMLADLYGVSISQAVACAVNSIYGRLDKDDLRAIESIRAVRKRIEQ